MATRSPREIGKHDHVPMVRTLTNLSALSKLKSMDVHCQRFLDYNQFSVDLPYVKTTQYPTLYNSMVRCRLARWRVVIAKMLTDLEIAVDSLAAVHAWYLSLPAMDPRYSQNFRQEALLRKYEQSRDAADEAVATDNMQIIIRG
jgi:hypothetical protein